MLYTKLGSPDGLIILLYQSLTSTGNQSPSPSRPLARASSGAVRAGILTARGAVTAGAAV